jgi:hypothetical protein
MRLKFLLLPAIAPALILLAGCSASINYVNIATDENLTRQQLNEALQGIPPGTTQYRECGLGEKRLWFPFITSQGGINSIRQGDRPWATPPVTALKAREPWIEATRVTTFGPLALLWTQERNAHFKMDGTNFGYHRVTAALWGILWWDKLARDPAGEEVYSHKSGLLFGGFGFGGKRTKDYEAASLRLFWIPITVSRSELTPAEPKE